MKILPHSTDTSSIVWHADYGCKDHVPLKQSTDALCTIVFTTLEKPLFGIFLGN
jgi:hypothetical protein